MWLQPMGGLNVFPSRERTQTTFGVRMCECVSVYWRVLKQTAVYLLLSKQGGRYGLLFSLFLDVDVNAL